MQSYLTLCLLFSICSVFGQHIIPNKGQIASSHNSNSQEVLFHANSGGVNYLFDRQGWKMTLAKPMSRGKEEVNHATYTIGLEFHNSASINPQGLYPISVEQRYIKGEKNIRVSEVYDGLKYPNLWKGIDAIARVTNVGLKYDFILEPHADLSLVGIHFRGAQSLSINGLALTLETPLGNLEQHFPEAYELDAKGTKRKVNLELYVEGHTLRFSVPNRNAKNTLVIDPWCTYSGGSDVDEIYGLDVDSGYNAYITGYTFSLDLPISVGVLDTSHNGDYDAFVTKIDSSGALVWSTYYGGTMGDFGYDIKVNSLGEAYLFGQTTGSDILVSGGGVFQTTSAGSYDSFILKLTTNGNFNWATYFGGTGGDLALAGDLLGDKLLIAGYTSSMDMPVLNPHQSMHAGALDAFVAVFDTTGQLQWSTYYGGSNSEDAHTAAFDENANVILGGDSYSTDFPTSIGAYQTGPAGGQDGYILKFDANGTREFATLIGGVGNDDVLSVKAINGSIYFGGFTFSSDFPVSTGAFQGAMVTAKDGFVAKFSGEGVYEYVSFYGGDDSDEITSIDIENNKVYALGNSRSSDLTLYGVSVQNNNAGYEDNMILVMDTAMVPGFSSYFGGASNDLGRGIRAMPNNDVYVAGFTASDSIAFGSNIAQNARQGQTDGYIFKWNGVNGTFSDIANFESEEIDLFPNPARNQIILPSNVKLQGQMDIYDLAGRKVIEVNRLLSRQVEIGALANGEYLIKVANENKTYWGKFFKVN